MKKKGGIMNKPLSRSLFYNFNFNKSNNKPEPTEFAFECLHDADEERLANPDLNYEFTQELVFSLDRERPRSKIHFLDQMEE